MDSKITKGSGNVFADMGMKNPEEASAKAKLAREINLIINQKKSQPNRDCKIINDNSIQNIKYSLFIL